MLGIYSSKIHAEEAIKRYKTLPGFDDHPNDFCISEFKIDQDSDWKAGFYTNRYENEI